MFYVGKTVHSRIPSNLMVQCVLQDNHSIHCIPCGLFSDANEKTAGTDMWI